MAIIIGDQPVAWGVTEETWGIAQSFSEGKTCNISEIKDINGDIVGASFYGQTNNASLIFLNNGQPIDAEIGASVEFANTELNADYYPTSISIEKSNTGFQRATINAIAFPDQA